MNIPPTRRIYATSLYCFIAILCFAACSPYRNISKSAKEDVFTNKALMNAHVGISIYDPSKGNYIFDHLGDKYFVPASNTKLPTCYTALKYLGDSLLSFYVKETADTIYLSPAGDPTFLNDEFPRQDLFNYLKGSSKIIAVLFDARNDVEGLGSGWAWNDYQEYYMAERSIMPVYGDVVTFTRHRNDHDTGQIARSPFYISATPPVMRPPYMNEPMIQLMGIGNYFTVSRDPDDNKFRFSSARDSFRTVQVPFKTKHGLVNFQFLKDTLNKGDRVLLFPGYRQEGFRKVYSQPLDSLLKIMMHRSDNFFAEQCLLMVSNRFFGFMDDGKLRDSLLRSAFSDLPQPPRWADGSGLSRYNLFSPRDFVTILNKMQSEFGMDRLKVIMATGGEGTIRNYYKADHGFIYGKTGTLSGVVAFSGFMYTRKGKFLIFSTLVNNAPGSATDVRRAIEKFLQGVRNNY